MLAEERRTWNLFRVIRMDPRSRFNVSRRFSKATWWHVEGKYIHHTSTHILKNSFIYQQIFSTTQPELNKGLPPLSGSANSPYHLILVVCSGPLQSVHTRTHTNKQHKHTSPCEIIQKPTTRKTTVLHHHYHTTHTAPSPTSPPAASPASARQTAARPQPACALCPAEEGGREGPPAERGAPPPPSPAERLPWWGASCQGTRALEPRDDRESAGVRRVWCVNQ